MRKKTWIGALAAAGATVALVIGCGGNAEPGLADTAAPGGLARAKARPGIAADVVLRGGKVVTMNRQRSIAQAVAVRDGRIVQVGSDAEVSRRIGPATKVIELGGRMLMPGFIDAHLHSLAGGRAQLKCDLNFKPLTRAQLATELKACLDASPNAGPDTWLEAVNWDRQSTSGLDADPTKTLLDSLPTTRPIVITSSDFHAFLANSRALALAGITAATPNPVGGTFLKDAQGALTGMCIDAAGFMVTAAIPPESEADQLTQGRLALAQIRAQGITTFMDAAAGEPHLRVFKALRDAGELTARVNLAWNADPAVANADPAKAVAAAMALAEGADQCEPTPEPGVYGRVIKVFLDGVVNAPSDNGALLEPYFTNAGTATEPNWVPGTNVGQLFFSTDTLKALMLTAADRGFDLHMHATGDRAVRTALDAAEATRRARPWSDFRPAIAHVETAAVADYPRFRALDVMATMSFQWAQRAPFSIGETENHLGPERFARMEPHGSLRKARARVVHGSDWPIDPFDTFLALKVGVTRSGDPANPNSAASRSPIFEGPINADPALTRDDVLAAITINAAYQLHLEDDIGTLETGKLADLIVLERDFLTVPDAELGRNRVLLTMVGGKVVGANAPFTTQVSAQQQALDNRSKPMSLRSSTGHAMPATVPGAPHGDGHRH
ncbi:MAG TPA: amidohydrolase family protein [Burkholderiaceae bacterium]|nr:amidohydrolase family protein [Burkholderiaceae bacterium]